MYVNMPVRGRVWATLTQTLHGLFRFRSPTPCANRAVWRAGVVPVRGHGSLYYMSMEQLYCAIRPRQLVLVWNRLEHVQH